MTLMRSIYQILVSKKRSVGIYKAIENGSSVSILVNDEALMNKSTIEELLRLKKQGCTINQNPNLHSKIYLNEKAAITWSLNLNHNSVNKSLEVGHQTNNVNELKKIENIIKRYLKDENTKPFTGKIEEVENKKGRASYITNWIYKMINNHTI